MISPEFVAYAGRQFGAAGREWLHSLPAVVAELEGRWSISTGGPIGTGATSLVLAAHTVPGERDLALKLSFLAEDNRDEARALRGFAGQGAVELLEADEERGALLLDRLDPAWTLLGLDDEEALPAACDVLRRLWRPPKERFRILPEIALVWAESLPRRFARYAWPLDATVVEEAVELLQWLAASSPPALLLHGDAHGGNFLAGKREPWLLIDPKPFAGDPAFDLAPLLRGRWDEPDTLERTRRRLEQLADLTGFDRHRLRGWALAKTMAWFADPPGEWELDAVRRLAAV